MSASLLNKSFRVDFRPNELDAWHIAKQLRQLSPLRRWQVRVLVECLLEEDALQRLEQELKRGDDDNRPGA